MSTTTSSAARIDYGTNRAGDRLLRRQWVPEGVPRALVLIVHGIAEHCGRYDHVARRMVEAGFGVVSFDQQGHGASGGRKGHVDKFTHYLDDVEDLLAELRTVGVPVVLLGHSMGGLVSTAYAVSDRPQPDLLVLSGPALGTVGVQRGQKLVAEKLAQLAPKLHPKVPFDPMVLSRDPAVAEAYTNDPLIKGGGSVNLVAQLLITAEATAEAVDRIRVPTLCLHGADDELVPADSSAVLEGVPGVEREVLDGLRHEILNEPEWPEIVDRIVAWVDERL